MSLANALYKKVEAVAPITSFVIGRIDDPATWFARYAPEATAEQIAAGNALIQSIDAAKEIAAADARHQLRNLDAECGMTRPMRDLAIAVNAGPVAKAQEAEAAAEVLRELVR